jgi:hypothetical protein
MVVPSMALIVPGATQSVVTAAILGSFVAQGF